MNRIVFIFLVLLTTSCAQKEYIILPPDDTPQTTLQGMLTITNIYTTVNSIKLEWNYSLADSITSTYEISLNDSVIAYDLSTNRYTIQKLEANKEYQVKLSAYNETRQSQSVTSEIITKPLFFEGYMNFPIEHYKLRFDHALETRDSNLIVGIRGKFKVYDDDFQDIIVKLDQNFNPIFQINLTVDEGIQKIVETVSGDYVVLTGKTIFRINQFGEIQWNLRLDEYDNWNMSVSEDDIENLFICSEVALIKDNPKVLEYIIYKISKTGDLIWSKYLDFESSVLPKEIIIKNDEIILFGQINYNPSNLWISWHDMKGNYLRSKSYVNQNKNSTVFNKLHYTLDNNFLICGTTSGYMNTGYHTNSPRLLKISPEGDIIWDCNESMVNNFLLDAVLHQDDYLIVTDNNLATVSSEGIITQKLRISESTGCYYLSLVNDGHLFCITWDCKFLFYNLNGYR